jgi:hypothetical protein
MAVCVCVCVCVCGWEGGCQCMHILGRRLPLKGLILSFPYDCDFLGYDTV